MSDTKLVGIGSVVRVAGQALSLLLASSTIVSLLASFRD